jgi:hypothetical protein
MFNSRGLKYTMPEVSANILYRAPLGGPRSQWENIMEKDLRE